MTEFEKKIEEEFLKQTKEIQKTNIAVVGRAGVGKSSLINLIFGENVARTGEGEPVTKGIDRYEPSNIPMVFFDTEGYEKLNDGTYSRNNFETKIIPVFEKMNSGDLKDHIHLVWYCISIAEHRVLPYDKENIKYFLDNNMKTAVVFTFLDWDDYEDTREGSNAVSLRLEIEEAFPGVHCFRTIPNDKEKRLDLIALIEWSKDELPNNQLRNSFITSQILSIDSKKKQAYLVVGLAIASTAATAGLNPIPISDSFLIVPQQIAMCLKITNIFWLNTGLSNMIMDLLKTQIITMAAKQAASSLTKLIPGFGQIINAAVAGIFTGGLGTILVEGNANALKEFLETGKMPDWSVIFSSSIFIDAIKKAIDKKEWDGKD